MTMLNLYQKTYLVSYDEAAQRDYKSIYKILERLNAKRVQLSAWQVKYSGTAAQLLNEFRLTLKHGDNFLVAEIVESNTVSSVSSIAFGGLLGALTRAQMLNRE